MRRSSGGTIAGLMALCFLVYCTLKLEKWRKEISTPSTQTFAVISPPTA